MKVDKDLSIVVPAWDRYGALLSALVFDLRRELPGARLIVVDNSSKIPLPEVGAEVIRLKQRVTTGSARNEGLFQVRTPFVCFFDADDLPIPGSLGSLLETVRADPACVGAGGVSIAWHPASSAELTLAFSPRILALQKRRRLFGLACVVRNRWPVVGAVLRTAVVRDAGGFSDLNYCEDWALATALAFRGRVHLTPNPAILSRIHEGSMIHRGGTPAGIVRALVPLYRRWSRDRAIPLWVKALFPLTALPRLNQAVKRKRTRTRSHDDLFAVLGRHALSEGTKRESA